MLKVSSLPNMSPIILLLIVFILMANVKCPSPLDEYVYHWDPTFSYKLLQTYPSPTYTVYILNMTSQTWLNGIITPIKLSTYVITFYFSFIFITTNLVALYDYYSAKGSKTSQYRTITH